MGCAVPGSVGPTSYARAASHRRGYLGHHALSGKVVRGNSILVCSSVARENDAGRNMLADISFTMLHSEKQRSRDDATG